MKRRRKAGEAGGSAFASPAPTSNAGGPEGGGHAVCRARAGELEARLAAAEAALSEKGGLLDAAETAASELRGRLAAAATTEGYLRAGRRRPPLS